MKVHSYYYIYGQHILSIDSNQLLPSSSTNIRSFHSSAILYDDRSKIEKTVRLLKKEKIDEEKAKQTSTAVPVVHSDASLVPTTSIESTIAKRKSIWQRIVYELKHYYNGFKLLFIETKIAFRLLREVLNGHTLTRRERKQVFSTKEPTYFSYNILSF